MLPLDDEYWGKLHHAYGAATSTAETLQRMYDYSGFQFEDWDGIGNDLCCQGSVYPASWAAFPHLIEIANIYEDKQGYWAFDLATNILLCTTAISGKLPKMPRRLADPFREGIQAGLDYLREMIDFNPRDRYEVKRGTDVVEQDRAFETSYLAAIATFRLQPHVACLIEHVSDAFECPMCGDEIDDPYSLNPMIGPS